MMDLIRCPFRKPEMAHMFYTCLSLATDNFSEFYIPPHHRAADGPRCPRAGAGHRAAFWNGYRGLPNRMYDKQSLAYAAYRAGQSFHKNLLK